MAEVTEFGNQYVDASHEMAMLLAEGVCVETDLRRAVELSAWNCQRQEHMPSCYVLAGQLLRGSPSQEDLAYALGYLRAGAYDGHEPSMLGLGWLYSLDTGPLKDVDAAVYWFHRAAEKGVAAAMYNLHYIYAARGPRQSADKARYWQEQYEQAGFDPDAEDKPAFSY